MKRVFTLEEVKSSYPADHLIAESGNTFEAIAHYQDFTIVKTIPREAIIGHDGRPFAPGEAVSIQSLDLIKDLGFQQLSVDLAVASVSELILDDHAIHILPDAPDAATGLYLSVIWDPRDEPFAGLDSSFGQKYGASQFRRYSFVTDDGDPYHLDAWGLDPHNPHVTPLVNMVQMAETTRILDGELFELEKSYHCAKMREIIEADHLGQFEDLDVEYGEHGLRLICRPNPRASGTPAPVYLPYSAASAAQLREALRSFQRAYLAARGLSLALLYLGDLW